MEINEETALSDYPIRAFYPSMHGKTALLHAETAKKLLIDKNIKFIEKKTDDGGNGIWVSKTDEITARKILDKKMPDEGDHHGSSKCSTCGGSGLTKGGNTCQTCEGSGYKKRKYNPDGTVKEEYIPMEELRKLAGLMEAGTAEDHGFAVVVEDPYRSDASDVSVVHFSSRSEAKTLVDEINKLPGASAHLFVCSPAAKVLKAAKAR